MSSKPLDYRYKRALIPLTTLLVIFSIFSLCACKKEDEEDRNNNYYNVLFITPKGERSYIGTVRGISSCKYTASSYYSHRLWIGKNWDYICCLRTKENECAEEHKYENK